MKRVLAFILLAIVIILYIIRGTYNKKIHNERPAFVVSNMFDSLSHAIDVRDSLIIHNHRLIESKSIDSLTYYVINYLLSGLRDNELYLADDDKIQYLIICRVSSSGKIKNVYLNNDVTSKNDSVITNYLLKMPKYENWNDINPYHQCEFIDIRFPIRVRFN